MNTTTETTAGAGTIVAAAGTSAAAAGTSAVAAGSAAAIPDPIAESAIADAGHTPRAAAHRAPARAVTAGLTSLVALAAVAKLLIHLVPTGLFGYGYFVDELYYLDCARHLAWGFVDMPPLFPAVVAALRALLGDSLLAVRLLPALAGAALVAMTGLMARDLGGRRFAQGIAALAVLTAPLWLVLHGIDTMNALEQLSWTGCAWILLRIVRDDRPRLWPLFGAVAGLGLLDKHSMAFFGVAVVAALLLTAERKAFRSPWFWLGGLIALAIFLPNLVWVVQHHFPHLEMLANIRRNGRDIQLNPLQFLAQQVMLFNPLALPLWLGGLAWLLVHCVVNPASHSPALHAPGGVATSKECRDRRQAEPRPPPQRIPDTLASARLAGNADGSAPVALDFRRSTQAGREGSRYRVLGLAWLGVMVEMFLLDGRPYYPAPAYPMLLAAGGVALERWAGGRRWRAVKPAYAVALALSGALLAPLFTPLLPPEALIRYSRAIGLSQPRIETHRLGPLPQLMADRFGWPEMAAEVARVYRSLPPADRARAAIFAQNYGQAGAIDLFGPALGLPQAISAHLSYYLWGPRGYTGEVMIVLDDNRETLERLFRSVELAGHVGHPYSMPYQHFDVFVCRGPRQTLAALWPRIKRFD